MSRFRRIAALLVVALGMLFAPGVVALANAADFDPGAGTYTANTTALTLTGPHTNITGTNQGGVAVFSFGNVNIPADGHHQCVGQSSVQASWRPRT